jgi:predicted membrane protein (TIGR00267 family)
LAPTIDLPLSKLTHLFRIAHARPIARRYFVVNGFDGALTMLGIIMGFYGSGEADPVVIVSACVGAAVALGMSGATSAYISEAAERAREFEALEEAMGTNLEGSVHSRARKLLPFFIAAVNGAAPLFISLVIIAPLWISMFVDGAAIHALDASLALALVVIFLLGVFLGRISQTFWLLAGLRTLLVAVFTGGIIYWLTG